MKTGSARKEFFDSRDKYLSFVRATDEKARIAFYLARLLDKRRDNAPFYLLDAGAGEGTVIATFLTAVHKRAPDAPVVVTGKEISIDDVCILLSYLPDRFAEHKTLVFHITNMTYGEIAAPDAAPVKHVSKALAGDTSYDFSRQLMMMSDFVEKHWALHDAGGGGRLRPKQKICLTIYRKDRRHALKDVLPKNKGELPRRFDFVIASQPLRLRQTPAQMAARVVAPLLRLMKAGGRLTLFYSSGRDFSKPLLKFLYPAINPYASAAPDKLLAAARRLPECAGVSARIGELRYGLINLYLGHSDFSLSNIYSLWNTITYVGQISEAEQRAAPLTPPLLDALRQKLARVKDKTFVNNVIHFRKRRQGGAEQ